jgi:leader peptidase (prepilin peptidase)/N-methyltransferase
LGGETIGLARLAASPSLFASQSGGGLRRAPLPNRLLPILLAPFIGSFLGVVVERLPMRKPLVLGRSSCDSCGHVLTPRDLVPVLSYLVTRGRCRYCAAPIGVAPLAIELAALGIAIWAASLDTGPRLWVDCGLGWALLTLAWIDARHMILPDPITLPLILAGLVWAAVVEPDTLVDAAIGAAVGYTAFRLIELAYRRFRGRDGLGEGDAKLLAVAGAWVGWQGLGSVVLVAALGGLGFALVQRLRGATVAADTAIPFGPFLAASLWLVWLYAT